MAFDLKSLVLLAVATTAFANIVQRSDLREEPVWTDLPDFPLDIQHAWFRILGELRNWKITGMENLKLTVSDMSFTPDGKIFLAGNAVIPKLESIGDYEMAVNMPIALDLLDFYGPAHNYNLSMENAGMLFEGKFAVGPEGLECVDCEMFGTIERMQMEGGPQATNCGKPMDWEGFSRVCPEILTVLEQIMFDQIKAGCPALMNQVILPNLGDLMSIVKRRGQ